MSENDKLDPLIIEGLKVKLNELKNEVPVIEAELVNDNLPVKSKPKFMDLATSQHYLENFINMTPKQIEEFIDKQSDMLMMFSKNAALEWLAKALETNDPEALEMYLKVIQASAVVAQEKVSVKKQLGLGEVNQVPKQYVAETVTQTEWEQTYKPGKPLVQNDKEKIDVFFGPENKSVN